jgi:hypothetical protein
MSQLDRIEAKLNKLLDMQTADTLSKRMDKALEQVADIKRQQQAATAPVEPIEVAVASDEANAPSKPADQFGDAPPVHAGKPDPASGPKWVGVPQWEKGREPRPILKGAK